MQGSTVAGGCQGMETGRAIPTPSINHSLRRVFSRAAVSPSAQNSAAIPRSGSLRRIKNPSPLWSDLCSPLVQNVQKSAGTAAFKVARLRGTRFLALYVKIGPAVGSASPRRGSPARYSAGTRPGGGVLLSTSWEGTAPRRAASRSRCARARIRRPGSRSGDTGFYRLGRTWRAPRTF